MIRILSYPAVNCYALISGYVGIYSKHRYSSLLNLFLQVLFYSVAGTFLFAVFIPATVGTKEWVKAFFPLGFQYWYFTAYFGLFFLMPLLNFVLKNADKEFLGKLLAGIFIVFSVLPTLLFRDLFQTHRGFSVIHLAFLYLAGGFIRRFDVGAKKSKCLAVWAVSAALTFASFAFMLFLSLRIFGGERGSSVLISYTSPTMVAMAVALLLIFKEIKIEGVRTRKIVSLLGAASFGIYLAHLHPLLKRHVLIGLVAGHRTDGALQILALYAALTAAIFLASFLAELFRIALFKFLRIKNFCAKLDALVERIAARKNFSGTEESK